MLTVTNPLTVVLDLGRLPKWSGWHLLGVYPTGMMGDVASWLLHHNGKALLLEVPPKLLPEQVAQGLAQVDCQLKYVTVSHLDPEHMNTAAWTRMRQAYPQAAYLRPHGGPPGKVPGYYPSEKCLDLGGAPCWLISAPKHSGSDQVVVFQGVAMIGDIELGTLDVLPSTPWQAAHPVPIEARRRSMAWLAGFPQRCGYQVHTTVSAHLHDIRENVIWQDLFAV